MHKGSSDPSDAPTQPADSAGQGDVEPRSASAAASTLLTADATVTLSSIDTRRLGGLAARKSGNKLNVRRPSGQYHRAIRSPRGVLRG
jgi:hypothetical protein